MVSIVRPKNNFPVSGTSAARAVGLEGYGVLEPIGRIDQVDRLLDDQIAAEPVPRPPQPTNPILI